VCQNDIFYRTSPVDALITPSNIITFHIGHGG